MSQCTLRDEVHLVLLSRVVESARFVIGPEMLPQPVSYEGLLAVLKAAEQAKREKARKEEMRKKKKKMEADGEGVTNNEEGKEKEAEGRITTVGVVSSDRSEAQQQEHEEPCDTSLEIEEPLRKLWDTIEANHSGFFSVTYQDLLDHEVPIFPETAQYERDRLKELGKQVVVSKAEVCRVLDCTEDEQLVDFIFQSGASFLPGEIFQDIVGCLEDHPTTLSFLPTYTNQMVESGRRMMTLIPFVALLITVLVVLPDVVGVRQHSAYKTVMHFIEADWENGCPNGVLSPLGCQFVQRHLHEEKSFTASLEGMRYVRESLVKFLWPQPGGTASDGPLGYHQYGTAGDVGSVFLVGALVVRLAPEKQHNGLPDANQRCGFLNLTEDTSLPSYEHSFDCAFLWSSVVPFNATREEAVASLENTSSLFSRYAAADTALVAQFSAYQPSTGIHVYTKISFILPSGGKVIRRVEVTPVDATSAAKILPLLVIQAIIVAFTFSKSLLYRRYGSSFFTLDTFLEVVSFAMLLAAYVELSAVNALVAPYQVESVPPLADRQARVYLDGIIILSFWCLLSIGAAARYLRDVAGLQMVVAILSHAALEITGLVLIFGIWCICFTYCAQLLFGSTLVDLASPFSSFEFIFMFFFGEGTYEQLEMAHPIWGPGFWFAFTIFVKFFVLNLLIAVVTAPLDTIKESSNLHLETYAAIEQDMIVNPNTTQFDRWRWTWYTYTMPLVNIGFDIFPDVADKSYWVNLHQSITRVYTLHLHHSALETVESAWTILRLLGPVYKQEPEAEAETATTAVDDGEQQPTTMVSPFVVSPVSNDGDNNEDTNAASTTQTATNTNTKNSHHAACCSLFNDKYRCPFDTVITQKVVEARLMDRIAMAFCIEAIQSSSRFQTVRDARMIKALLYFDHYNTSLTKLTRLQDDLRLNADKISRGTVGRQQTQKRRVTHIGAGNLAAAAALAEAQANAGSGDVWNEASPAFVATGGGGGSSSGPKSGRSLRRRKSSQVIHVGHAKEVELAADTVTSVEFSDTFQPVVSVASPPSNKSKNNNDNDNNDDNPFTDPEKLGAFRPEIVLQHPSFEVEECEDPPTDSVRRSDSVKSDSENKRVTPLLSAQRLQEQQEQQGKEADQKNRLTVNLGGDIDVLSARSASPMPSEDGEEERQCAWGASSGPHLAQPDWQHNAKRSNDKRRTSDESNISRRTSDSSQSGANNAAAASLRAEADREKTFSQYYAMERGAYSFKFTIFLRKQLQQGRRTIFYLLTMLALFLWFFITGFNMDHSEAYLTSSVSDGLRDMHIKSECYDANCSEAFSIQKTFMETGDLADWYVWVEKVLARQLFLREESPELFRQDLWIPETSANGSHTTFTSVPETATTSTGASNNTTTAATTGQQVLHRVLWDPRTTFTAPIYVRQIRAARMNQQYYYGDPNANNGDASHSNCDFGLLHPDFSTIPLSQRLDWLSNNFECRNDARGPYATQDLPKQDYINRALKATTNNINRSDVHISDDAFRFRDWCPEQRGVEFRGYMSDYPCNGYTTEVHNATQLKRLMQSGWFDNSTRLAAVTINLQSGAASIEYTLYVELGEGGGSCYPSIFSLPLSEDSESFELTLVVGVLLLSIDTVVFLANLAQWFYFRYLKRKGADGDSDDDDETSRTHAAATTALFPEVPVKMLVLYSLVFVIPYIAYPQPVANERIKFQIIIVAFFLTFYATQHVFFPIAGLFSKRATTLLDTLVEAVRQSMYVVPFFIIFLLAFTYSGIMIFGGNEGHYARFRNAFAAVSRGALGVWDSRERNSVRPEAAPIYNFIFFAVMLVLLANLILSMVTSAASDALMQSPSELLAENIAKSRDWHVMYGDLYEFFLAWDVWFSERRRLQQEHDTFTAIRRFGSFLKSTTGLGPAAIDSYRKIPAICLNTQRLFFPAESLATVLGPHRANEVLFALSHDELSPLLYPSSFSYIIDRYVTFASGHWVDETMDVQAETSQICQRELELRKLGKI